MIKVALYLRRSTNEQLQPDSLRSQEELLRVYARTHRLRVVKVFRDSASGTTVSRRTGFLAMADEISSGASFSEVLVRDVTRFGRFFDVDEGAFWHTVFASKGVKVNYVEESFPSDLETPMIGLMRNLRRVMATEFSREKSRLIRYGKSRAARLGFRSTGTTPYGLRRVMVKPDGTHVMELGRGEWKAYAGARTRLAHGKPEEIAAIRRIFEDFTKRSLTWTEISTNLNADGVRAPRGGKWTLGTVQYLLRNPAYAGIAVYRACHRGSLDPLAPSVAESLTARCLNAWEAVVSMEVWQRAQQIVVERVMPSDRLPDELRRAYAQVGAIGEPMVSELPFKASWHQILKHGGDEILIREFASKVQAATKELLAALGSDAEENIAGVVKTTVRRKGRPTLQTFLQPLVLRTSLFGAVWSCRVPNQAFDMVIGLLIPPREEQPIRFALLPWKIFGKRKKPLTLNAAYPTYDATGAAQAIQDFRRVPPSAAIAFREMAWRHPCLNFRRLARELGWSEHAVSLMYKRLTRNGENFPVLQYLNGRRLTVTCSACGATKQTRPNRALALRGSYCFNCNCQGAGRQKITCPNCGYVGQYRPSLTLGVTERGSLCCYCFRLKEQGRMLRNRRSRS